MVGGKSLCIVIAVVASFGVRGSRCFHRFHPHVAHTLLAILNHVDLFYCTKQVRNRKIQVYLPENVIILLYVR